MGMDIYISLTSLLLSLRDFEGDTTEIICLELTILKKKIWFIASAYRLEVNNSKYINCKYINWTAFKYDNLLFIGDLNIVTFTLNEKKIIEIYDLCDYVSLKNLMTDITCVKSMNESSIAVLLTMVIRNGKIVWKHRSYLAEF